MKTLRSEPLVWALLCAGVGIAYAQTLGFEFVNVDDSTYISKNRWVRVGLSIDGILWLFGYAYAGNWMPVTWISYMLDCSVFGVIPGALHGVDVFLHGAASYLLFSALLRLSSAAGSAKTSTRGVDPFWPSAVVAALFALHPAHVESVAWIAERKGVLSGFFWMLTLLAYAAHANRPSWRRIAVVCAAFALGLMSKSIVVTLPCVLLLLDIWPLQRLKIAGIGQAGDCARLRLSLRSLVVEKLPLFALAALAAGITYAVNFNGSVQVDTIAQFQDVSPSDRSGGNFAGLPLAYARYLELIAWPTNLAFLYPHLPPESLSFTGPALMASILLALLSAAAILLRRSHPYLLIGWLWFLGTLVPVIRWLPPGEEPDRYTYLPSIGIFIALSFGAASLWPKNRQAARAFGAATCALLLACTFLSHRQARHWRNSMALWTRSVSATENNAVAYDQLGLAYVVARNFEEAIPYHRRAVALRSESVGKRHNLGNALMGAGRLNEARIEFQTAITIDAKASTPHYGLANILYTQGDFEGALDHFESFAELATERNAFYVARLLYAETLRAFLRAPDVEFSAAIARSQRARALRPGWTSNRKDRVWALATDPRAEQAEGEAPVAITEEGPTTFSLAADSQPNRLAARGAALAAAHRFDEAVAIAKHARRLARKVGDAPHAHALEERIARYRAHERYVEKP